jgi:hypothetical protein
MVGYFTYDVDLPPGRQTNSRPILAFGNPAFPDRNEYYRGFGRNSKKSGPDEVSSNRRNENTAEQDCSIRVSNNLVE